MTASLPSLTPLQTLHRLLPSLPVHGLFFHALLLNAYMYLYIHTYSKIKPVRPYIGTCMFAFRDGHLPLDKQLVFSSLGIAPSFPQLPVDLCVGLRSHDIPHPIQFGMFVDALLVQLRFGQSCCLEFTGTASNVAGRQNLTANSPIIWFLQSFWSLFPSVPSTLVMGMFLDVSIQWDWAPQQKEGGRRTQKFIKAFGSIVPGK